MNLEKMIITKIDPLWTLLEKARFIYIELGKLVTFSTKFQNTDISSMAALYTAKVSIDKLDSLEVNCRMWSQLYSQLLYRVGIPNKIVGGTHTWVEFYIDEETYIADATGGDYNDLARIKNNEVTDKFGKPRCSTQKKPSNVVHSDIDWINKLNAVDKTIGCNISKREEMAELKIHLEEIARGNININELAHSEVEDPISFKLDYLFTLVGKLNNGYYESKDFVYNLESRIFTPEELKKVGAVELKRTNHDKTVSIIQCIYTKHKDEPTYYLLAPNLPVQRFTAEEILTLSQKGYGIQSKTIPGIIYPKAFIPGKCSETLSYRLYKNFSKEKTHIDQYAEAGPKYK